MAVAHVFCDSFDQQKNVVFINDSNILNILIVLFGQVFIRCKGLSSLISAFCDKSLPRLQFIKQFIQQKVFFHITNIEKVKHSVSCRKVLQPFFAKYSEIRSNNLKMIGFPSRNARYSRNQATNFLQLCTHSGIFHCALTFPQSKQ